ncbi:uncharacterized protein LOC113799790 [Dermatophagoides pteronyssinus]
MENDDQSVKENDNDGDQMKIDRISSDDLSDQSIKRKANEMSENVEQTTMNKRAKQDRWIYSTNQDDDLSKPDENKKDDNDDNQSLDEGEIVDDDDDDDDKIGLQKTLKIHSDPKKSPINDDDNDKFEEGECNDQISRNNANDDDGDDEKQDAEIASNYSDWSESEDDLLIKNDPQPKQQQQLETKIDSNDKSLIKNDNDLEAISDDDIDTISDILNNKNGDENVEKLLKQQKDNDGEVLEKKPKEPCIVDALNIVWCPLIVDNNGHDNDNNDTLLTTTTTTTSNNKIENEKKLRNEKFRKQNSTLTMLNRIGFSQKYAGPLLTDRINDYLAQKLGPKIYQPMLHPLPALHSFYLSKQMSNDSNSLMGTKMVIKKE